MNGTKKFHNPDGPAFNEGEIWYSASGVKARIERIERWGLGKWDADVYYSFPVVGNDQLVVKNAWSFQVRYQHEADKEI